MGKTSWVCFDCRESVRRDTQHRSRVPCPKCGEPCQYLGYKIPVPPKRDVRAWTDLREQLRDDNYLQREQTFEHCVRRRHQIEKEIKELEARPDNAGRRAAIRKLREQLEGT